MDTEYCYLQDVMTTQQLLIPVRGVQLEGEMEIPLKAAGLVLFAHGSGSSRHSPRNQLVARALREAGLGTVLFDLLSHDEEQVDLQTRRLRFDIPFLADRLARATQSVMDHTSLPDFSVGYFGSSTGAAAALVAAASLDNLISAVVSRGGRSDLAGDELEWVRAATLLIVGGEDRPVIELNREAYERLQCERALRIVPGATHLFEEPGTLETVAKMAADWFVDHFAAGQS